MMLSKASCSRGRYIDSLPWSDRISFISVLPGTRFASLLGAGRGGGPKCRNPRSPLPRSLAASWPIATVERVAAMANKVRNPVTQPDLRAAGTRRSSAARERQAGCLLCQWCCKPRVRLFGQQSALANKFVTGAVNSVESECRIFALVDAALPTNAPWPSAGAFDD